MESKSIKFNSPILINTTTVSQWVRAITLSGSPNIVLVLSFHQRCNFLPCCCFNIEIGQIKIRPPTISINCMCSMKEIWYTRTLKLLMLTNEKSADQHHLVPGLPSISEWQRARQQTAGGENTQYTMHNTTRLQQKDIKVKLQ